MLTEMAQTLPEAPTLETNCVEIQMPATAPVDLWPIVPAVALLVMGVVAVTAIVEFCRSQRLRLAMAHEPPATDPHD